MKILLVGEYSGFHNSLKAGLSKLGHEVVIVGNRDSFKRFPVDIDLESKVLNKGFFNIIRQGIFRITAFDIGNLESIYSFYRNREKLKNYDIVQLINEYPIQTDRKIEKKFLQFIFRNNKKVFLSACSDDFTYISFLFKKKLPYSILSPYFKNLKLKTNFKYSLAYISKSHQQLHKLVFQNIKGVICGDMDYKIAYDHEEIKNAFIPFPVKTDKFEEPQKKKSLKPIVIFHGINRINYYKKGNEYFEAALVEIEKKFQERVKIITAESLPYKDYIISYQTADILLDQIYAYDQGYNGLEAMAQGKVVFTGAEKEFLEYYNLKEDEVCINALPDVDYLVEKLSWLIENPKEIERIAENAVNFIHKEHYYVKIAERYLEIWKQNI